jgi:hypothetical protein
MTPTQEQMRALIDRRQKMLERMGRQLKKEHHGIEERVDQLIASVDSRLFFPSPQSHNRFS